MRHHTVEYVSDYLVSGVSLPSGPGFHQITLSWNPYHPETQGSFHIDPNSCGLDAFGDRTFCTKIAVATRDMKLTLLAEKPGRRAYTIETRAHDSKDDYAPLPLRLVTVAAEGHDPARVRLLVVKADQSIERIIELHQQHAA